MSQLSDIQSIFGPVWNGCAKSALSITLLLAATDCSAGTGSYTVYESSEGGGVALVMDLKTEQYTTVMGGGRYNIDPGDFTHRLTTITGSGYYYETQLRIVIPFSAKSSRWGNGDILCTVQSTRKDGAREVSCAFRKFNRSSSFVYDQRKGVTEFRHACRTRGGLCNYKLSAGRGLFAGNEDRPRR